MNKSQSSKDMNHIQTKCKNGGLSNETDVSTRQILLVRLMIAWGETL